MLGLPPFETEIRRRLWWQLTMLESIAQVAGTGTSGIVLASEVKMPLNINDSDLHPGMQSAPKEHQGVTEMIFFLLRCNVGYFIGGSHNPYSSNQLWNKLTTNVVDMGIKDKAIDDLAAVFEDKYLKFCDPSIPWHFMVLHTGRAIICMMRFMAHSATKPGAENFQMDRDLLFDLSLRVMAAQNMVYIRKELWGFKWQVNLQFQYRAFIYVLSELPNRLNDNRIDQIWTEVGLPFQNHPSFFGSRSTKALPIAISNLALRAWNAYIIARGPQAISEPHFIQHVRHLVSRTKDRNAVEQPTMNAFAKTGNPNYGSMNNIAPAISVSTVPCDQNFGGTGQSYQPDYSLQGPINSQVNEQVNWSVWNDLLIDMQTQESNETPVDIPDFCLDLM